MSLSERESQLFGEIVETIDVGRTGRRLNAKIVRAHRRDEARLAKLSRREEARLAKVLRREEAKVSKQIKREQTKKAKKAARAPRHGLVTWAETRIATRFNGV